MSEAKVQRYLFICVASQSWDTPLRTNRHYMMEQFARTNFVIFIESLGLRMPTISKSDVTKIIKKLFRSFLGARKTSTKNLYALDPFILPLSITGRYSVLDKLNQWLLICQIRRSINSLDRSIPRILWSYIPSVLPLVGKFNEKLLVYDCVDDCSGVSTFSKDIIKQDTDLTKIANVVFALSKPIYEDKKNLNDCVVYAPGAADKNLFGKAMAADTTIPNDIVSITKPVLGYIGNLADHKQDFELIEYIALKKPEWSIVLIGPIWSGGQESKTAMDKLKSISNIYWLGVKPHIELPAYLKAFDVCLIPQKNNSYARSSFPMKLFEYLGSGKPVVATFTEALAEFHEYIWLSETYEDFIQGIEHYLNLDTKEDRKKRLNLANINGWETRFKILIKTLNQQNLFLS